MYTPLTNCFSLPWFLLLILNLLNLPGTWFHFDIKFVYSKTLKRYKIHGLISWSVLHILKLTPRWHPEFDLNGLDLPAAAELPKPPVSSRILSVGEMLEQIDSNKALPPPGVRTNFYVTLFSDKSFMMCNFLVSRPLFC